MIRFNGVSIDRREGRITYGGAELRERPKNYVFRLACMLLLAGPKSKKELFDMLYYDDADGGPLESMKVMDVRLFHLRRRFAEIGIDLVSMPRPGGHRYFAEPMAVKEVYAEAAE